MKAGLVRSWLSFLNGCETAIATKYFLASNWIGRILGRIDQVARRAFRVEWLTRLVVSASCGSIDAVYARVQTLFGSGFAMASLWIASIVLSESMRIAGRLWMLENNSGHQFGCSR